MSSEHSSIEITYFLIGHPEMDLRKYWPEGFLESGFNCRAGSQKVKQF
jgi:hypothetical protein